MANFGSVEMRRYFKTWVYIVPARWGSSSCVTLKLQVTIPGVPQIQMGGHKWVPQRRGFPFYGVSAFTRNWKWGAPPDAFTLSPLHLLATVTFLLAASLLFAPATPPSSVAPSTSTPRVRRSEAGFLELPMRYALRWYVWYALFFLTLFCVLRVVMFYAEQFCALFAFVFLGRTRFKRSTALGISLILILLAFVPSASAMPTVILQPPLASGTSGFQVEYYFNFNYVLSWFSRGVV